MKLFAWDFHGTLEQGNINATYEVCKRVLEDFGIARPVTFEEIDNLYGNHLGIFFRYFAPSATESELGEMVNKALKMGELIAKKYTKATPFATEVLKNIINKGDKNVIVSAMRQTIIPLYLDWTGLDGLFVDVAGVTEEEQKKGGVAFNKKAEHLKSFIEKYKPEHVTMIGDREVDITAGKQVGATTFLFSPNNKNIETKADFVITDLREVLKVYESF